MKKDWTLTGDSFYKLLQWLDADTDRAGEKYEEIRERLIKMFIRKGCNCAEDLADNTINRVARKLDDIYYTYVGDPIPYFYAVAQHIYLEFLKKTPPVPIPASTDSTEKKENSYNCLEECLKQVSPDVRELVIGYYEKEGADRIKCRKQIAEKLDIDLQALRVRIARIKLSLSKCVRDCLKNVD